MKRLFFIVTAGLSLGLVLAGNLGCTAQAKKERHLKKAEAFYQKGDYAKAEIEYLNARRFEFTNALAASRLAMIYARQGDNQIALQAIGFALALSPTNTELQLRQGMLFQGLSLQFESMAVQYGDVDMQREALMLRRSSRETAAKVLSQEPRNGEALLVLAGSTIPLFTNDVRDTESRMGAFRQQNGENAYFHLAAAALMMQEGNRAGAEAAVQKALGAEPKLYQAHLRAAEFALSRSNLAQAEAEFKKAIELAPVRSEASLRYANYKALTGQTNEAVQILKEVTAKAPDFTSAWKLLAQFAFQGRKPDQAVEYLNRMLFKNSANFEALHMRAESYYAQRQYTKAGADLDTLINSVNGFAQAWQKRLNAARTNAPATGKARSAEAERQAVLAQQAQLKGFKLTFYPQLPGAYLLAAQVQNALTNQVKAADHLTQALNLVPGFVEARIFLTELNLRRGLAPETTISGLVDYAGRMEKRIAAMDKAVGRTNALANPAGRRFIMQYYQAVLYLADTYARFGRLEEAATIYRKLVADNPRNPAARLALGNVLQRQNKPALARAEYEQMLKLDPTSLPALAQLTALDIALTNQAVALKRVQAELAKNPQSPQLLYLEGMVLGSTSNTLDQAEAVLRKSLEVDKDYTPAYALMGRVLLGKRQIKEAEAQLAIAFEKQPNDTISGMLLAAVYKDQKQDEKARQVYEKILSVQPNFLPAMNDLAYLYCDRLNQLEKAYEWGRKARTLAPQSAFVADTFGWILYRQGDFQQALALIQESAAKLAENPEVQYHLGMAHYMFGHVEAARTAMQLAANATADYSGKEEAKKYLALLQSDAGKSPAQAIADLEKMLKDNPRDLVVLVQLGELYLRQKEVKKAAETFEQVLKVNPRVVTAVLELAKLNAGPLADRAKALDYARKARELSPANPDALRLLGQLSFQAGDIGAAYNLLDECQRLQPGDPQTSYDLGWAAYGLGKLDEARQAMEQAQTAPNLANAAKWFLSLLGHYENPQNLASVEPQVNELLKSDPNYVPGLLVIGLLQNQRGQVKEAVQTFEKILARFPQFPPAQRALAILYATDPAQEKKAFDLAMKARVSMPDDPALARTLGRIYHQRKDYLSAVRFLQDCLRNAPSDAEALYFLGSSYLQLKDKTRAKDALQKSLAAGLKAPLDAEAKRLLGTL